MSKQSDQFTNDYKDKTVSQPTDSFIATIVTFVFPHVPKNVPHIPIIQIKKISVLMDVVSVVEIMTETRTIVKPRLIITAMVMIHPKILQSVTALTHT